MKKITERLFPKLTNGLADVLEASAMNTTFLIVEASVLPFTDAWAIRLTYGLFQFFTGPLQGKVYSWGKEKGWNKTQANLPVMAIFKFIPYLVISYTRTNDVGTVGSLLPLLAIMTVLQTLFEGHIRDSFYRVFVDRNEKSIWSFLVYTWCLGTFGVILAAFLSVSGLSRWASVIYLGYYIWFFVLFIKNR